MKSYAILNQGNLFLSLEELKAIVKTEVDYYYGIGIFNKEPFNVAKRSSLIKASGEVIAISTDVKDITDTVKGNCYSIGLTLPMREYKNETLTIYNEITKNVKLSKKCEKLDIIYTEGVIIAGIRKEEKDTKSLIGHSKKPYSQSGTLAPEIARLLVNLSQAEKEILDPFMGTGSILIEAKWLGLNCIGFDIDDKMIEKTRTNLSHFRYECDIMKGDAGKTPIRNVEAITTDPPYGRSFSIKEGLNNLYENFFHSASEVTKTLVFTTDSKFDWREKLKEAGFREISIHFVYNHKSLSRAIYVVRK